MGTFAGRIRPIWFATVAAGAALTLSSVAAAAPGTHGATPGSHRVANARSDTSLPTWRNLYDWPNGHGYVGWHSATTASDDYGMASALGGNYGLWLWPLGGHKTYDTSDYAEWTYTAPGTTRLESATLSYAWSNKLLAHHCFDLGLRTADGTVIAQHEQCSPPPQSPQTVTLSDPAANPTATVVYFRIHVDCGGASSCSKTIPSLDPLKNGAYARLTLADMTLVDDDLPSVSPSGALYDLAYGYINGTQSYDLTTSAQDAGSGIVRAWLERAGSGQIAAGDAPCDPTHNTPELDARICPDSFSFTTNVDTGSLPEGRSDFQVKASDVAGNVGASDPWPVFIDRTPPAAVGPGGFSVAWWDSSNGDLAVDWADGVDPALPDGNPGSGIASYEYRYDSAGAGWTDWTPSEKSEFLVPGTSPGDQVSVEVRATDGVGNVSAPADGQVTVDASAPSPPDEVPDAPTVCKDGDASASCDEQIGGSSSSALKAQFDLHAGTATISAAAAASPPPATRSIYEHQATTSVLKDQGCTAGHAKARGAVILAFGRPAVQGSTYGTVDYDGVFISNSAIVSAANAYIRGFVQCSGLRGPTMKVAVGTTNGCVNGEDKDCCPTNGCGLQVANWHKAGSLWLRNIEAVSNYVNASRTRSAQVAARGADDAEPAWEPLYAKTKAFIDGYNETGTFQQMYDFGSGETGFWTDSELYNVAYGLKEWPFPQIYLSSMADEWGHYAQVSGPFGKMHFVGVMSQWRLGQSWLHPNDNCGLTPQEGWTQLVAKIPQTSIAYLSNIVCRT